MFLELVIQLRILYTVTPVRDSDDLRKRQTLKRPNNCITATRSAARRKAFLKRDKLLIIIVKYKYCVCILIIIKHFSEINGAAVQALWQRGACQERLHEGPAALPL